MNIKVKSTVDGISYFGLYFLNTTINESKGLFGISHIIEHCMCEKVKELESQFQVSAIEFNAITSKYVEFYIYGLEREVKKYKDIFKDYILNYKITQEVFERERAIILEEFMMAYSDQYSEFNENFMKKRYNFTGPIGTYEDIKNLTYEQFISFKEQYFVDPFEVEYSSDPDAKDFKSFDTLFNFMDLEKVKFGNYSDIPMEHFVDFKENEILEFSFPFIWEENTYDASYLKLLSLYMSEGLTSPLYKELREKLQLVYAIFSNAKTIRNTRNCEFSVTAMLQKKDVNQAKEAIVRVFSDELDHLDEQKFNNLLECWVNSNELGDKIKTRGIEFLFEAYQIQKKAFREHKLTFEGFKACVEKYKKQFSNFDNFITSSELV